MIRAPIWTLASTVLVSFVPALTMRDANTLMDRGRHYFDCCHVRTLNASGIGALLIDQPDNAVEVVCLRFPTAPLRDYRPPCRPAARVSGDARAGCDTDEISVDSDIGVLARVAASDDSWEARLGSPR